MDYYRQEGERYLADRWREVFGRKPVLKERGFLTGEQWSPGFEAEVKRLFSNPFELMFFDRLIPLMKNRLLIGACRYGLLNDPDKPKWDRLERFSLELDLFKKDRNMEHLVDAMNMLLLEWEEGDRRKVYYIAIKAVLQCHKYPMKFYTVFDNQKVREL